MIALGEPQERPSHFVGSPLTVSAGDWWHIPYIANQSIGRDLSLMAQLMVFPKEIVHGSPTNMSPIVGMVSWLLVQPIRVWVYAWMGNPTGSNSYLSACIIGQPLINHTLHVLRSYIQSLDGGKTLFHCLDNVQPVQSLLKKTSGWLHLHRWLIRVVHALFFCSYVSLSLPPVSRVVCLGELVALSGRGSLLTIMIN